MNAYEFVAHARANNFTAAQVRKQFPGLPGAICQELLTGTAYIDHINPDGSVVIDDGVITMPWNVGQ